MYKTSKSLILVLSLSLINVLVLAQNNDITKVADKILGNNPDLQIVEKIAQERLLEIKIGINPKDPGFEFQRSQEVGGTNPTHKFSLSQEFDFPTSYIAANKLRKAKHANIQLEIESYKQELKSEICKDILKWQFLKKKEEILINQSKGAKQLEDAIRIQYDNGETGILEFNKMKLFARQIQNKLRSVQIQKQNQFQHLVKLNGGKEIDLSNIINMEFTLQDEEQCILDFMQNDAVLNQYKSKATIATSTTKMMQNKWLPSFGIGISSERNQTAEFRGISFGMRIPIWERRYTVATAKAGEDRAQTEFNSIKQIRFADIQIAREQARLSKELFENLQEMYDSYNSQHLLQKALESGYINLMDFLREYNEYYLIEIEIIDQEEMMIMHLIDANIYRL
jgi:cobalt-zinc-cadmium resistance protein CzcA